MQPYYVKHAGEHDYRVIQHGTEREIAKTALMETAGRAANALNACAVLHDADNLPLSE